MQHFRMNEEPILADVPATEVYFGKARRKARRDRNLMENAKAPKGKIERRRAQIERSDLEISAEVQQAYAEIMR